MSPSSSPSPASGALDHAAGAMRYELRFAGLFNPGRGYVFPCDAKGHVDIDRLGERARNNYFFARGAVGAEFYFPVTCAVTAGCA